MKLGRAFLGGVLGGAAMSVLLLLARATGIPAELEMMLGTMFLDPGPGAFAAGLVLHLMISGLIALIYGWGFETIADRAGPGVGALFAIVHILIGGVVMAAMPAVHPLIPDPMPAPGAFMSGMGAVGVALFVIGHLLYGAIVGAVYGRVLNPRGAGGRVPTGA